MRRGTLISCIILFWSLPILQCTDPEIEQEPIADNLPDQELWDSEIHFTEMGTTNAIIHAGHLAKFNENDLIILNQKVEADFYQNNEHASTLYADSAIVEQQNNMQAFGNVIVESDSGITLLTEQLFYTQETNKITSDTFVTLTSEMDTLHGKGFSSDPDLSNWIINQPTGVTRRELQD